MGKYEIPSRKAADLQRAELLARKINLLLDVIVSDNGKPYEYTAIRDAIKEKNGYFLSRTRWTLLKAGKVQVVPDEALRAIAVFFDVNPEYLIQDEGKMPERVEAELALIRSMRRAEVLDFAARALGPIDPDTLLEIAKILDDDNDEDDLDDED